MDAQVERRFAIGPFSSEEALRALAIDPPPARGDEDRDLSPHALIVAKDGAWLCTTDPGLRDRAVGLLGSVYTIVMIDCWNAFSENATVARFRIERHRDGAVDTEHADRRYPDLARAGVLPAVTADWLAQKVRGLSRARGASRPAKKESEQRERAERMLSLLEERGAITLAPGSTISDLGDRTRRILFVLSRTRREALNWLTRMFRDSQHVSDVTGRAEDLHAALDAIRYRK